MKRREFVEKLGIGSALIVSSSALSAPGHAAQDGDNDNHEHNHRPISGDLANATVSFGAWPTGQVATPQGPLGPLDRYPNVPPAPPQNIHQLIPYIAKITQGGSVNFVIAGLHQVIVYGPGTKPQDIRTAIDPGVIPPPPTFPTFQNVRPFTAGPLAGQQLLINVPQNRIYAGPDPSLLPLDRVEVVHFSEPGLYLVICGFALHFFFDNMYGYVRVRRNEHDND